MRGIADDDDARVEVVRATADADEWQMRIAFELSDKIFGGD